MAKKTFSSVGIEYDRCGIRSARIATTRNGNKTTVAVDNLQELIGDFSKDELLVEGLKNIARKTSIRPSDYVVTCASGRQVFMGQMRSKKLSHAEMKKTLRTEIRKNISFDTSGSILDYQIMDHAGPKGAQEPPVAVTAVAKSLIDYQMRILSKAGIEPSIIDVLPAVIANSFWIGRQDEETAKAHVMLHFSPDTCTLVIDGQEVSFYTRSIYFSAEDIYGVSAKEIPENEKMKQLEMLGEEIRRSLSYYTTNYGGVEYGLLYPMGSYIRNEDLRAFFRQKLDLAFDESTLFKRMSSKSEGEPGTYDIAVALAMRGGEVR
ncbi:MAG: pilus assembly protein PilM [Chitinispirillaceae bacterium]|nr:pilus assembly protein PilM [Chitinispirillaceae bacterium]